MSVSTQLQELSNCKTNIKGAITNKGIDMTDVAFTDYPAKISEIEISAETVVYDYGTWNSDYAYATYIPSGASITFDDSYITLNGGGAVPQLGFTLKDEDVGRMVYMLIKPTTYSTTLSDVYRFGMGYQSTAVTSSDGGTETASARSIPYSSGAMVDPALVGIPALEKYIKIFVGTSQIANVYKIWLGEKYIAPVTEETTWTYKTGNLYTMTANTTGTFTASKAGWKDDQPEAYTVFDGQRGTDIFSQNPNESASSQPAEPYVKIMFGKSVRIAEIQSWIGYGANAVTYSRWFSIYGIKEDGTEVLLGTNNSGDTWASITNNSGDDALQTHTVSEENQQIPFVGLIAHRAEGLGGNGYYFIGDIQVTKWYEAS